MIHKRSWLLAGAALLLLIAGLWLSLHRSSVQGELGGGRLFADLAPAVGEVSEIRLSKGDGSRVTLRRQPAGWTVVEREYAADASRVRELILSLTHMKIIEHKTSDPANYAKLGVEAPDSPTAASTLLEVVAGQKTWALVVGKNAEVRAVYVRKPSDAVSALAEPAITVDPDPKRWLDRQITDMANASIREIAVKAASGPSYLLSRASAGQDLALSPVPKGRTPASSMSLNAQADALTAFNFDDMRPLAENAAAAMDRATFRSFDGQVLEFAGRKEGGKAYVTVSASRDVPVAAADATAPAAKPADQTAERLATRAQGIEFEIPLYKYDSLFKPQEQLLEPKEAGPKKQ